METSEILAAAKTQALKDVETLLKNQVAVAFDPALELAGDKVKALIPGQVDDVIVDLVLKNAGPILKELLLQQIEKIAV